MCDKKKGKKKFEALVSIIAMMAIVVAWFIGRQMEDADILSSIKSKLPDIENLEEVDQNVFKAFSSENNQLLYVAVESSMGYGGPLKIAAAIDSSGKIHKLAVLHSKEPPSYLEKVLKAKFIYQFVGLSFNSDYSLGSGIDAVSSATYSSHAIAEATKKAVCLVAEKELGFDIPGEKLPAFHIGAAEIILLLLFSVGYFAHKKTFRYTRQIRWITMLVGLLVLGFFIINLSPCPWLIKLY